MLLSKHTHLSWLLAWLLLSVGGWLPYRGRYTLQDLSRVQPRTATDALSSREVLLLSAGVSSPLTSQRAQIRTPSSRTTPCNFYKKQSVCPSHPSRVVHRQNEKDAERTTFVIVSFNHTQLKNIQSLGRYLGSRRPPMPNTWTSHHSKLTLLQPNFTNQKSIDCAVQGRTTFVFPSVCHHTHTSNSQVVCRTGFELSNKQDQLSSLVRENQPNPPVSNE